VISEIRTRGAGGAADEFVELFNATGAPVTLGVGWKIEARATTSLTYTVRWSGTGKVIPAWGHYLVVGTAYTQAPAADDLLLTGVTDASAVRLVHQGVTVDTVCFYFDAATMAAFDATYGCPGTPVSNLPHNNTASLASNVDASIERKPGGPGGNCTDTQDNAADFTGQKPATPDDTASPPTP
jgi:hypothetical protein